MESAKPEMVIRQPYTFANPNLRTNFAQITDATQHSVFLQKEIEEFATEMKTDKNLILPGNVMITRRVHDQRLTGLCVSFSTITIVRGALINHLDKIGVDPTVVKTDLENTQTFSFNKMLVIFTGCVSPRSLDGLILNSKNNPDILNAQFQQREAAIDRLVYKTEFEDEGWLRISPLVEILKKYAPNVDLKKVELTKFNVFHPNSPFAGNNMTFNDAIQLRMLILAQIFNNTLSSVGCPVELGIRY